MQRTRESWFKATPGKQLVGPFLEKQNKTKGLAEWLKW
jgi:hypothetical protein